MSGLTRRVTAVLAVAALLVSVEARAAERTKPEAHVEQPHLGGQREFAFGPTLGAYSGNGTMIGVGSTVGVWLSGGYMPLLIRGDDGGDSPDYEFMSSVQANADLSITFWHPKPRSTVGAILGYKYNNVLEHGASAGITFEYDLSRVFALRALGGVSVFPNAEDGLREHGYPNDVDPLLSWLQGGVNLGIAIYP